MYGSRSRWFTLLLLALAGPAFAAPPVVGPPRKNRLMVVIDNSRSMQATPANDYDLSFRDHRLTTGMMTSMPDGTYRCDETAPAVVNGCKNKFCVGQCVLHNAFDSFAGNLDFGFATYNQYYTKYTTKVADATASGTTCYYDVIAGPGEVPKGGLYAGNSTSNNEVFVSKLGTLNVAGSCKLSERTDPAARNSLMIGTSWNSQQPWRVNELNCGTTAASGAIPLTPEQPKDCTLDLTVDPNAWPKGGLTATAGVGRVDMALRVFRNSNENITGVGSTLGTPPLQPYAWYSCRGDLANCSATPTGVDPSSGQTSTVFPNTVAFQNWINPSAPQTAANDERGDGNTWYLFRSWLWPDPAAPGFVAGPNGDFMGIETNAASCPTNGTQARVTTGQWGTFSVGGVAHMQTTASWSSMRCSTTDPCIVTHVGTRGGGTTTVYSSFYKSQGASYTSGALTYTLLAGQPVNTTVNGTTVAAPPACPATVTGSTNATYGCSAGNPCDLTGGTVQTLPQGPDTSKFSYGASGPFTTGGLTYTATGTTSSVAAGTVGPLAGSTLGVCPSSPPSTPAVCADANNLGGCNVTLDSAASTITATEPKFVTCVYKVVKINLSAPRPDQYRCNYTRGTWNYSAPDTTPGACQWQIRRYEWRPRVWKYTWKTGGGELIDSSTSIAVNGVNHCAAGTAPPECPARFAAGSPGAPANCTAPGRECRLRWVSPFAGAMNVTRGRQRNANSSNGTGSRTADRYCRMTDYGDSPMSTSALAVTTYQPVASGGWCQGTTGQTDQYRDTVVVTSDPFSPATASAPNNVAAASYGVGQVLPISPGRALTAVAHGLNPAALTPWISGANNGLPWPSKEVGWSRLPNGTPLLSAGDWGDPGVAPAVPLFRPLPNPSGTPPTVPTTIEEIRESVLALSMPSVGFAPLAATAVGAPTLPASCTNGYRDVGERFVDCGGGGCPRCPVTTTTCTQDSDCPAYGGGAGYGVCDHGTFSASLPDKCVDEGSLVGLTGHNTPLYGALSNFRDYLQNEIVDSDAKCRRYGVVLVTDGLENQPTSQPQHPAQSVYTDFNVSSNYDNGPLATVVRDINTSQIKLDTTGANRIRPEKGVPTFVVGFGSAATSDPNLEAMAKAGRQVGLSYQVYQADSPALLRSQLYDIFQAFSVNTYARSRPMITRDASGSRFYIAYYQITGLGMQRLGYLDAYDSAEITAPSCGTPPCPTWQLSDVLNAQSPAQRKTYVVYGRSTAGAKSTFAYQTAFTTPLTAPLTVGNPQRTTLMTEMGLGSDTEFNATMAFVRNDSRSEPFNVPPIMATNKTSRLSDIDHSSPALIGPPAADDTWPAEDAEKPAYIAFKGANVNRPSRIIVGSNTGLIHSICEKTGTTVDCGPAPATRGVEVYAVVPPSVLPTLSLTRTGSQPTADGSFGAADLCLAADCTNPTNWRTFVLGGMRAGSRALLAMDVSNPNVPAVQYEFQTGVLGQTWSPPVMVRANYSHASSPGNRWIAVLGGGYEGNQNLRTTANSVLVLDVKDGQLARDSAANDASFRVDSNPTVCDSLLPTDPSCPLPRNNLPARMAVTRIGKSAAIKNAYIGDTQGRSWVMRIGGNSSVASWAPHSFFDPYQVACAVNVDPAVTNTPIIDAMATDSASPVDSLPLNDFGVTTPKPIYQQALVSVDADGRVTTFFGTGDEQNDSSVHPPPVSPAVRADVRNYDYFYAVRDQGAGVGICEGAPVWVRRFGLDEKMLSLGTIGGAVVFVPVYVPSPGGTCDGQADARIYAFYSANGGAAAVFDDPTNAGGPRRHYSDCIGCGRITDLQFVQNPANRNQGTLLFGRESGRPDFLGATGIAAGAKVKSFKRVR